MSSQGHMKVNAWERGEHEMKVDGFCGGIGIHGGCRNRNAASRDMTAKKSRFHMCQTVSVNVELLLAPDSSHVKIGR